MEKKKTKKINLKTLIIIIMVIIVLELFFILFLHVQKDKISTNIEFEYDSIEYYLKDFDCGFLESKFKEPTSDDYYQDRFDYNYDRNYYNNKDYIVFDNYSSYEEYVNTIDKWSQDRLKNQKQKLYDISKRQEANSSENISEADIEKDINDTIKDYYQESIEDRTKKIKDAFLKQNIDEKFFENNSLIVVEKYVLYDSFDMSLKAVNVKGDKLDIDFLIKIAGADVQGGRSKMYFLKIPKRYLENVKEYNVNLFEEKKK